MTTELDLTDAERAQLRVLYSVYLNPTITATYSHDVVRSLIEKHLAQEAGPPYGFPMANITARGIEIAQVI